MSTAQILFGRAAKYLELIDEIVPIATKHDYTFVSDEWFETWSHSEHVSIDQANHIIMHELLEKSHLAAITALIRARRWADAVCRMSDGSNFVGWAASLRGLLESAGDTVDGLINVPTSLARNYDLITRCLAEILATLAAVISDSCLTVGIGDDVVVTGLPTYGRSGTAPPPWGKCGSRSAY